MRPAQPVRRSRISEGAGLLLLALSVLIWLSLASYNADDPSWNSAASRGHPHNWVGLFGSHVADITLQTFGLAAFTLPLFLLLLSLRWIRSREIGSIPAHLVGVILILVSLCTGLAFLTRWEWFHGAIQAGGVLGLVTRDALVFYLNPIGTLVVVAAMLLMGLFLCSRFSIAGVADWIETRISQERESGHPRGFFGWLAERRRLRAEAAAIKQIEREEAKRRKEEKREERRLLRAKATEARTSASERAARSDRSLDELQQIPIVPEDSDFAGGPGLQADLAAMREGIEDPADASVRMDAPPWDIEQAGSSSHGIGSSFGNGAAFEDAPVSEIPIEFLEETEPQATRREPWETTPAPSATPQPVDVAPVRKIAWRTPSTELLREAAPRSALDEQELKETAARIKSKFEEFNVLGNVVQINPGPVVTTFEFKPEAGIKYSKMTNLTEDLCLGLQAESVMIERIPGKPTVGIEVPNSRRDTIALRQILESDEFRSSTSRLTFCLGKDIRGRIKVANMEQMPHLLIAGSTGAGKSVMLNALIVSVLYKSTPDQVRLIMVDPKQVELGIYEGIPHLLTPVITDPKKASVALGNAVIEMERRLRLLASYGVRNIEQFNRKMEKLREESTRSINLFEEEEQTPEPLPYVLLIIDELADLMMLEGRNVEASITRLAQMARAVGIHLVVATQRPSVDVITGLIKANFPARLSFRVATRVDSRTILDVMGAEHLLGKGDMLFLPPGSSRLVRMHGAFVEEQEINSLVAFWKNQAAPEYDDSFLISHEVVQEEITESSEEDPVYRDAVKVVLEMGKASTSILQRRLRVGYGRAARILDQMEREGIIGPPDGPRPRDVLKRPDWAD
ncbi:MAG: DNA translocase FtsK [Bryobacterales bacterium]|nr:DNA translocase FtsK [Bryobacterales bacterium]